MAVARGPCWRGCEARPADLAASRGKRDQLEGELGGAAGRRGGRVLRAGGADPSWRCWRCVGGTAPRLTPSSGARRRRAASARVCASRGRVPSPDGRGDEPGRGPSRPPPIRSDPHGPPAGAARGADLWPRRWVNEGGRQREARCGRNGLAAFVGRRPGAYRRRLQPLPRRVERRAPPVHGWMAGRPGACWPDLLAEHRHAVQDRLCARKPPCAGPRRVSRLAVGPWARHPRGLAAGAGG